MRRNCGGKQCLGRGNSWARPGGGGRLGSGAGGGAELEWRIQDEAGGAQGL